MHNFGVGGAWGRACSACLVGLSRFKSVCVFFFLAIVWVGLGRIRGLMRDEQELYGR